MRSRIYVHLLLISLAVSTQLGHAITLTDAGGRKVELPAKVERVYAAGPPASVAVFAIAPDKLIGRSKSRAMSLANTPPS